MLPRSLRVVPLVVVMLAGCLVGDDGAFVDHEEASDFDEQPPLYGGQPEVPGIPAAFDRNLIVSDALFTATAAVTADDLQRFFEASPYGTRSWLADEAVAGVRAADAIVAAAQAEGVNPVLLVARMQVEKSLVSATKRPTGNRVDFAFGCGCPDGRTCSETYRGLDKQVACAASTLRRWYDASADGTGAWRRGVSRKTLDPIKVVPGSHATATLYAYTPWVLTGRGGNWLVWNITRKYLRHLDGQGGLHLAPTT
ncbi:MAG: hypothetical protein R3B06_16420 [Kofleriaceae bacterium]